MFGDIENKLECFEKKYAEAGTFNTGIQTVLIAA
jgi:hypothetical protein